MIKDISKTNNELYLNILLHVTILFTILSILFTMYISKVSSKIINNEIDIIIKKNIDIDVIENKIKENKKIYDDFIAQFDNSKDINEKIEIENKMKEIYNIIENLHNEIKKDNNYYDYYYKLFSKENNTRKGINNEIFFYMKFINGMLIVFFILFLIYLIKSKSIDNGQIINIFIENILTFLFVGIIEFLFFKNIIMKYVPIEPSLLIKSFLDSFQKNNIYNENK
jgi:hypothetical protein